ncbi:hypothetical protein B0H13DRAFT_1887374 [Mycena leptocephala]|nr:hypothetical protein B0H13DRAFT_1887374 [Mycena leptocephala]
MSLHIFSFSTTADEVAIEFASEIRGKNGIGYEAARVIAKHANLIVITGYNIERLKLSEAAIREDVPSANIRPLTLDLSSLAAIRKAAEEVNAYSEPLHVLIHNAAAAIGPFKLTVDNLEMQMATDHIGPFLLTKLRAPKLLAASTPSHTPRVVFVSSAAHAFGPGVDSRAPQPGEPKCANILTAIELSKRSKGNINAYSLHPGGTVIYTNINQKEESIEHMQSVGLLGPDCRPNTEKFTWKTISQGAATTVAAAFDTRFDAKPGTDLSDSSDANGDVAPHCSDPANAEKLWALTEEITGESFTF